MSSMRGASVRDGGRGRFVDEIAVAEALEREGRVDRVRLVVGDRLARTRAPSPALP